VSTELEGVLYFSKDPPEIIGHLVIGGVHYEIVGVPASAIRADIKARRRDGKEVQLDLIEDIDGPGNTGA
jgi:hypothetical protein